MSIILSTMPLSASDPFLVASLLAVVATTIAWLVLRGLASLTGR